MAHIVAEPCIKCRYTECVSVCPVDCFYEGANFLAIHPEECIDCGACVPVCPANAIFPEDDLPEKWARFKEINAEYSLVWPKITRTQGALPDADKWATVENKADQLDTRPGTGDADGTGTDAATK